MNIVSLDKSEPRALASGHPLPNRCGSDELFEQWLTHGDEYYWYHQQQLQQSAITFESTMNPTTSPKNCSQEAEKKPIYSPKDPVERAPQSHACIALRIEPIQSQSMPLSKIDIEQFVTQLEQHMQPVGLDCDHKRIEQNRIEPHLARQATIPTRVLERTFRPYQLFINEKQVELSLNLADLSKPQRTEVQHYIQQWLNQKGYALKQFMINGVKQ